MLPDVLDAGQVARGSELLWQAAQRQRASGAASAPIDPNDCNLRVYMLPAVDQFFVDLLTHPVALEVAESLLGTPPLVSNFTANIALPGSASMRVHSDQALVVPDPWLAPWALNVIWCFDDVYESNGATRYLPGSHLWQHRDEVPKDALAHTVAFTAPAGSILVMDGRLWHTSGANTTTDTRRAMAFAYYTVDFLRQQVNWQACLPSAQIEAMPASTRALLGLSVAGNTRMGAAYTRLDTAHSTDE